jgi:hypothetical protein
MPVAFQFAFWATHVLDVAFFAGLAGCASVVVLSWISILKEGFSDDDDEDHRF